jgi:hypothetical protein
VSDRICYYVVFVDSHWAVRFDHTVGAHKFVTLADAIEAARLLARERWEDLGRPSGVRIESTTGAVIEDLLVGPAQAESSADRNT